MPSRILKGKTPFELLYRKKPDLSHLRIFGCLCYVTTVGHKNKMAPRAHQCIFMGYLALKKGYQIYMPSTGEFIVSRDVVFHEDIFPFNTITPSPEDTKSAHKEFLEDDSPSGGTLIITSPPRSSGVSTSTPIETPLGHAITETPEEPTESTRDIIAEPVQSPDISEASTNEDSHSIQPELSRRPSRITRPPTWTKDYICGSSRSSGTRYPISSYVSFSRLSPEHLCYISRISEEREPSSYNDARDDPR